MDVLRLGSIATILSMVGAVGAFAQDTPTEFFEKRIRPVLSAKCHSCHGDTRLGGLQLTSRAALLAGGKSGPAITPGNAETSLLIRAITQTDPKLKMPAAGEK